MVQRETLNIYQILVLDGVTICHAYRENNTNIICLLLGALRWLLGNKYIYPAQRVVLDFYGHLKLVLKYNI